MLSLSVMSALSYVAAAVFAAFTFLFGKSYGQSEKILDAKRKCYEDFLRSCPAANEAHSEELILTPEFQRIFGVLVLYGSHDVICYAGEYIDKFGLSQPILQHVTEPLHPVWAELATSYNRMTWAMRVDATAWSFFAPAKKAREYKPTILGGLK